ncbi:hypothetical protein JDV02_004545 [Purpureocillium takamizusanense]|uniref:Uncharacterized protein n=1 Tax=Purpureocillium takamizusanense TaxID=2060973 RepID=A0A9Q8QFG9_9HYPO|nr:uncharacterized protein JDV02_004545 [Purpureocillium takamizusanense]UNI18267.1 hypothetical protein JDV02_004545 [Purpureocillium takamizusanense]
MDNAFVSASLLSRLNMLHTLVIAFLLTAVVGDYKCPLGSQVITIRDEYASAAMIAGGISQGSSGFPKVFVNQPIEDQPAVHFGNAADDRCNDERTRLLEFPVNEDGSVFQKNGGGGAHGRRASVARVVYLEDGRSLCGVMTHLPPLTQPNTCMCQRYRGCEYYVARSSG